jgi:fructose-specific phosphotransferase system IIA component
MVLDFKDILNPVCIELNGPAQSKDEALEHAVQLLAKNGMIIDSQKLLNEVKAREELASTGIGNGVAIPHALSEFATNTMLAILRLEKPIDFDAADALPVDLLFLMTGPKANTPLHLKILSKLARSLHDEQFRASLREASNKEVLAELIFQNK